MKNSNPLKYFNDQADARKKALMKAQVGVVAPPSPSFEELKKTYQHQNLNSGPLDKTASSVLDSLYPSTSGTGKNPIKSPINMGNNSLNSGQSEILLRDKAKDMLRGLSDTATNFFNKKGGSVKYKKRK